LSKPADKVMAKKRQFLFLWNVMYATTNFP
jgi:hypothetical protein